jgi:1,4-alpha-glucan branching enzyme
MGSPMLDLWYKNAIIYCLDVDTFMDSNGDGVGDFQGLADRLDHVEALGATCVWLLPFYPSPDRDNGYDVTDFYGVDRRLGTLGDFVNFTRAAHDRGLRVIVDLVVNHTSIDHPLVPGSALRSELAFPRLVCVVEGEAQGRARGDGVSRRAGQHLVI